MKCQNCREHLIAYIEGVLEPGKAEELGRHLEGCAACSGLMEEHARLHARLMQDGEVQTQGNMDTRVMDRIFREQTLQARRLINRGIH
jgi:anti-sigma factor RsiW